jgi:hypothetical protein
LHIGLIVTSVEPKPVAYEIRLINWLTAWGGGGGGGGGSGEEEEHDTKCQTRGARDREGRGEEL